jgi:hypothetical protein
LTGGARNVTTARVARSNSYATKLPSREQSKNFDEGGRRHVRSLLGMTPGFFPEPALEDHRAILGAVEPLPNK